MRELGGLAERKEEFDRVGAQVFAVSVDSRENLAELQEDLGLGVTIVADPLGTAVKAFGMIDPLGFPKALLARSGSFLIDHDGVVTARWLTAAYRLRPEADEILRKIRG